MPSGDKNVERLQAERRPRLAGLVDTFLIEN
jgi:hypothetical protein